MTTDFDQSGHVIGSRPDWGELSVTPQPARHDLEQAALESDTTVQMVARAPYPRHPVGGSWR